MSTNWRRTWAILLCAACVAGVIYTQAHAGKKGGGGSNVPAGTIYFIDHAAGFSYGTGVPQIFGMSADGSGKFPALPEGIMGEPSYGTYGALGGRWWLTLAEIPDPSVFPDGTPHQELFAVRPDPTDPTSPDGLEWVQLTDLSGASIKLGTARWSNDGLDSFVSFQGYDFSDDTDNIYRLWLLSNDPDLFPSDLPPCGLADLEVVLTISRQENEQGQIIRSLDSTHTWSPDGTQLASFVSNIENIEGLPKELHVKNASDDPYELGTLVWAGHSHVGPLDWSPDGNRILFVGRTTAPPSEYNGRWSAIWTITPDGLEATVVRYDQGWIQNGQSYKFARWSPDSNYIVMLVTDGGSAPPWTRYIGISPIDKWHLNILTRDLDATSGKVPVAWVP